MSVKIIFQFAVEKYKFPSNVKPNLVKQIIRIDLG